MWITFFFFLNFLPAQIGFAGAAGKFSVWGSSRTSLLRLWPHSSGRQEVLWSRRSDWLVSYSGWAWTLLSAPCTLPGLSMCLLKFPQTRGLQQFVWLLLCFSFSAHCRCVFALQIKNTIFTVCLVLYGNNVNVVSPYTELKLMFLKTCLNTHIMRN